MSRKGEDVFHALEVLTHLSLETVLKRGSLGRVDDKCRRGKELRKGDDFEESYL